VRGLYRPYEHWKLDFAGRCEQFAFDYREYAHLYVCVCDGAGRSHNKLALTSETNVPNDRATAFEGKSKEKVQARQTLEPNLLIYMASPGGFEPPLPP
jgi:hypothetical protein